MQLAAWCVPWKLANSVKNTVLLALQFQKRHVCNEFPGGEASGITGLVSALCRGSLMLAFNCPLLNRE